MNIQYTVSQSQDANSTAMQVPRYTILNSRPSIYSTVCIIQSVSDFVRKCTSGHVRPLPAENAPNALSGVDPLTLRGGRLAASSVLSYAVGAG